MFVGTDLYLPKTVSKAHMVILPDRVFFRICLDMYFIKRNQSPNYKAVTKDELS
jgi:hypothetical protein